jgi:hypothetical protein
VAATVAALCDSKRWESLVEVYVQRKRDQLLDFRSGLLHVSTVSKEAVKRPARLALFLVPDQLIQQWGERLMSIRKAAFKKYGIRVCVWAKTQNLSHPDSEHPVSMERASKLSNPVFWVVSEQPSGRYAERDHPNVDYGVRVYDELTASVGSRDDPRLFSNPITNLVVNATLYNMASMTGKASHHPLSYFFDGNWTQLSDVSKFRASQPARCRALTYLCSPPDWLRSLIGADSTTRMPAGIQLHRLCLAKKTVQTELIGSDLLKMTAFEVFCGQINTNVRGLNEMGANLLHDKVRSPLKSLLSGSSINQKAVDVLSQIVASCDTDWMIALASHRHSFSCESDVKGGLDRLTTRLQSFLETATACLDPNEDAVEDAVTLESIPVEKRIILSCCGKLADRDSIISLLSRRKSTTPKCPLCRTSLDLVGITSSSSSVEDASKASGSSTQLSVYESLFTDLSKESVIARFSHLPIDQQIGCGIQWFKDTLKTPPGTMQGIAALLTLVSDLKPALRALVVVKEPPQHLSSLALDTAKKTLLELFRKSLPSNFNVSLISARGKSTQTAVARYKSTAPTNEVLLLFLKEGVNQSDSTVAGLDLPMTSLTIFESKRGASSSLVQAVGRSLRMQSDPQQRSEHKHIVILESE